MRRREKRRQNAIINYPFDFFVDGNLLRTSIAKLAKRLGKSAEQTLIIEYVPAQMPPEEENGTEKRVDIVHVRELEESHGRGVLRRNSVRARERR